LHSTEAKKGSLDLSASRGRRRRKDLKPWQAMIERSRPARCAQETSRNERRREVEAAGVGAPRFGWTRRRGRAGDPRPRAMRRLGNAEYDNPDAQT